jgi:hypothetical protein
MPRKIPQHLHKYERVRLGAKGSYVVFRCILPGCPHYIRKELAAGKACLCNRCNSPMVLDSRAMSLQKPHCNACVKRISNAVEKLTDLFRS